MSEAYKVWRYNEAQQVGKDYGQVEEVAQYEARHGDFRDIEAESRAVLDLLGAGPGHVLADIGCGTGVMAIQAAGRCARVHAVDVSAAMLEHAANKAAEAGVSNIAFHHSGFLALDLPQASVDFVTSSLALHHLPDFWKSVALQRIHQALKPGGIFHLHDVILEQHNALANIQAAIDSLAHAGGQYMREDAEAHFREEYSTFDWIMEGLLQRAGFSILEKTMKDGVFGTYRCQKEG